MRSINAIFLLVCSLIVQFSGHALDSISPRITVVEAAKYTENTRWWYPGEPLTWVKEALLDSLLNEGLDGFVVFAESPRARHYHKAVQFLRSAEGDSALFVLGDCRYISYDGGITNSSRSIVNGHNHHSRFYWRKGTLFFQSGHANWMRHAQRLYHSRETLQMERYDTAEPPEGIELSCVIPLESGAGFLYPMSETQPRADLVPAYFLPHSSNEFKWWGAVNPNLGNVNAVEPVYTLRDYTVFRNGSSFTVIRMEDLQFVQVPSRIASLMEANYGDLTGTYTAWKGNRFFKLFNNGIAISESLDSLVNGAIWSPLILPIDPPKDLAKQANDPIVWAWPFALVMTSGFLVLLFDRAFRGKRTKLIPVEPSEGGMKPISISKETERILLHCGRQMGADAFDQIIDLDKVESPETRRSRRSRYIQLVNAEAQARFGRSLIERVRSKEDKRVMTYKIIRLDRENE